MIAKHQKYKLLFGSLLEWFCITDLSGGMGGRELKKLGREIITINSYKK
jgi:hypothetical protein